MVMVTEARLAPSSDVKIVQIFTYLIIPTSVRVWREYPSRNCCPRIRRSPWRTNPKMRPEGESPGTSSPIRDSIYYDTTRVWSNYSAEPQFSITIDVREAGFGPSPPLATSAGDPRGVGKPAAATDHRLPAIAQGGMSRQNDLPWGEVLKITGGERIPLLAEQRRLLTEKRSVPQA